MKVTKQSQSQPNGNCGNRNHKETLIIFSHLAGSNLAKLAKVFSCFWSLAGTQCDITLDFNLGETILFLILLTRSMLPCVSGSGPHPQSCFHHYVKKLHDKKIQQFKPRCKQFFGIWRLEYHHRKHCKADSLNAALQCFPWRCGQSSRKIQRFNWWCRQFFGIWLLVFDCDSW